MSRLDAHLEDWSRLLARRTGRRSFLGRVGALLAGTAALPLLPVSRASGESSRVPAPSESIPGPEGDPTRCEYWRHCAIDGFLCACCGGSDVVAECLKGTGAHGMAALRRRIDEGSWIPLGRISAAFS